MKFPVCPYCKTKYSSKTLTNIKGKHIRCPYCRNPLSVSRYRTVLLVLCISIALVLFDFFQFLSTEIQPADLLIILIANSLTIFSVLLTAPLMLLFDKKRT